MSRHLDKIEESVERGRSHHSPQIMTLLDARITTCRFTLGELQVVLAQLSPEMLATHEKLVSILRSLSGCNTRSRVSCWKFNERLRSFALTRDTVPTCRSKRSEETAQRDRGRLRRAHRRRQRRRRSIPRRSHKSVCRQAQEDLICRCSDHAWEGDCARLA